ncbi:MULTISPECIES: class II fructose-bisphosphate aldolase [unclassified Nocardia]|uniref:class II fructose-bisphosphate aldolase n=1 Tax=unclassified Nocardia TaxID=2637762 RepID=UPI001CE3E2D8|nr:MULTISPECIES: class II fructose-bisphosphate aldolase [unclassified Nocardia]
MANTPHPATVLLADLAPTQALCAFNVETFDTLHPALRAAADAGCPVVLAYSVPAARYLGYSQTVQLVQTVADWYPGVAYALHLDHCEDPDELRAAVAAGFSSANLLNEGALSDEDYLAAARTLHAELGERVSLEFVLGRLAHIDDPNTPTVEITAEAVARFAQACSPDIVGFDCGSVHGMAERSREIDIALIGAVATTTGLPIVLHGSSGVQAAELRAGIDAGLRKINIETALRKTYVNTARAALTSSGPHAGKPRFLTKATDEALGALYAALLADYTLRKW